MLAMSLLCLQSVSTCSCTFEPCSASELEVHELAVLMDAALVSQVPCMHALSLPHQVQVPGC